MVPAGTSRSRQQRAAITHTAMSASVKSDSQRTLAKSWNHAPIARLTPTASALAARWTNMSMNAFALYFSSADVGT